MTAKKELISKIKSLKTEKEKKVARELLLKLGVDLSEPQNNLTGTINYGFIFDGKYYADYYHHREVFLKVMELILVKFPNDKERIFTIKGSKRKYFSRDSRELSSGESKQINGTDIYTELNCSAVELNRRCQKVMQLYGLDHSLLVVL